MVELFIVVTLGILFVSLIVAIAVIIPLGVMVFLFKGLRQAIRSYRHPWSRHYSGRKYYD